MTRTRTRPRLLLGLVVVLLVTAVSTTIWVRAGAGPDRCTTTAERAAERAALVTGRGREVLVVGDSYSVGSGVRPDQSWPVRLPGRVRVDGFSGSGFGVHASACGDLSYAGRAARAVRPRTGLVVVEGGLNDHDQPLPELEAGFARLMRAMRDEQVVVVGPPPAPAFMGDRLAEVDRTLARLAAEHGASYLSMIEVELTYLEDDLHPDPAGHQVFGDLVAEHVARLDR